MKLITKYLKSFLILFLFFASLNMTAQGPGLPTDDGDVTDNPGAPIAGLVPIAVIIGAGIGIFVLRNKE